MFYFRKKSELTLAVSICALSILSISAYAQDIPIEKINMLSIGKLSDSIIEKDWLVDPAFAKAHIFLSNDHKTVTMTNGLISRVFRITPNLSTIKLINHMENNADLLRAPSPEGEIEIDGATYPIGGLSGQFEYGYCLDSWIDDFKSIPNSFQISNIDISDYQPQINWANRRWALEKKGSLTGKRVTFTMTAPKKTKGVELKLHFSIFDGLPVIHKSMEIINKSEKLIHIKSYKLEQLAMVEGESYVDDQAKVNDPIREKANQPNIHLQSDYAFCTLDMKYGSQTYRWSYDKRYTSQISYPLTSPCLLEVMLPAGPDITLQNGETLNTFNHYMMPYDSTDRQRQGLFVQRLNRKISPWITENPIFMHCVSRDEKIIKEAIDQCVETGYEMVILSFGSGVNMIDSSVNNTAYFKTLTDYAKLKNIELGSYSLLASRRISDDVDVINPKTGKPGGAIFGNSPCLSTNWGTAYFENLKAFIEKSGMTILEHDGSYPGDVCASEKHSGHKGLDDSQWTQREQIKKFYNWCCENGIFLNVPDLGYILDGANKSAIGYREVNWSLPRARQIILGRQNLYDGLWTRMPGNCWTFVPLTQYHGGGAAATLEPLKEHLKEYRAHMIQNYGSGVQACYRGHRLYDSPETKTLVKSIISWYKNHRDILNSEVIHLRRPDGNDWDGILHVNPQLKEKAMAMLYNPTLNTLTRTIRLPLYYAGLTGKKVKLTFGNGTVKTIQADAKGDISIEVQLPPEGDENIVIEAL